MKQIPLSEPIGGDKECCIHEKICEELYSDIKNIDDKILFRCPFLLEVDETIEYAGEWNESCNFEDGDKP